MIGTLRRHQSWVWVAAIPVIIISFVYYYGPGGQSMGDGRRTGNFGTIAGRSITQKEHSDAYRELQLLYFFRNRTWPQPSDFEKLGMNPQREIYNRILLHELMRQNGVVATPEAIATWIKTVFRSGEGQPFNRAIYDGFIADIGRHGATAADLERFAAFEIGRDHLGAVYGASGTLVTPEEAKAAYRRENDLMVAQAVFFPASNYLAKVEVSEAAIGTYYTNNAANFRTAEQRTAAYVSFPLSNYFAKVDADIASITNLQQQLETQYLQIGVTNFTDKATGRVLSKDEALAQMKSEGREQAAASLARQDAVKLINAVFAATSTTNAVDNLDLLRKVAAASTNGYTVATSLPFEMGAMPPGLKVPEQFSEAAFAVSVERPVFSTPIVGEDAVYVVGQGQIFPSRARSLEEVRSQVVEGFKASESARLAREAGTAFAASVTNSANAGKKFADLAAAAGYEAEPLPPFSLSSSEAPGLDPSLPLGYLQQIGFSMKPGETSPFRQLGRAGLVFHLVERQPVADAKMQAELPDFTKRIQAQRRSQAFMDWVNRQAKALNLAPPPEVGS